MTRHPILVVGDLILDEYLIGRATRLSREAAVPVLERTRHLLVPGGAANPAVGVAALGGQATLVGVVGDDAAAQRLREALAARSVAEEGVVVDASRPTTTKLRIIAEGGFVVGQHLARIDHVERRPLDQQVAEAVAERLRTLVAGQQAILVSDYKAGVLCPTVLRALDSLHEQYGIARVVDSQGDLERFAGYELVKCNRAEAEAFLGAPLGREREGALAAIRERTRAGAVVVTLGGDGIAWMDDAGYGEAQAPRAEVYDVTGAGDTVIAVLALAHAAGMSLAEGCRLAVRAAALTVRAMGNHAPTWEEVENG